MSAAYLASTVPGDRRIFEMLNGAPSDEVMLIVQGRRFTYGWMREQALRVARGLYQEGVQRNGRVAVWLPNSVDWFVVMLACSRIGASLVSLNIRLGAKEVGSLIARTQCQALVMDPQYREGHCVNVLRSVEREDLKTVKIVMVDRERKAVLSGVGHVSLDSLAARHAAIPGVATWAPAQPDDECLVVATSGTTSQPKLVAHRQDSVCRHAADVSNAAELGLAGASMLLAIPLSGAFGYTAAMAALHSQCTLFVMDNFDPVDAAALLVTNGITHMLGTNDMLNKLLDVVPLAKPFPDLRLFGHANFDPSLTELPSRAEAAGVHIRGFYGMSELLAGFATQASAARLERRAEAGGVPVCAAALFRIVDPETGVEVSGREHGELQVLTPNKMIGYLENAKANEDALTPDGYFRTGDLAYRDEDEGFTLVSRINDVLRIGGYLVSPIEIEDVVARLAQAQLCQVVAVSRSQGVRPVAFVVLRDGAELDEASVLAACREHLAKYKVPVRIYAVQGIPMVDGPNGQKINRVALRQMASEMLDAEEAAP